MAITKQVTYDLDCEGPCKRKISKSIPKDWARLKILPAIQQPGRPAHYYVSCLCFDCQMKAIKLLQTAGYKISFVEGKDEQRS